MRRSAPYVVLVLLLALTLSARVPGAIRLAVWQDEIASERVISQPSLRDALRQIVRGESTPPAFYVIARTGDRAIAGRGAERRVEVLRGLSIVFGLGCTAVTFALACELMSLWAATLAGLLVAFSSMLVLHGSELRAYSLLALACAAYALLLQRAAAQPVLVRLTLLSVVVAFGSLTHYFFLFTFVAGALWLVTPGLPRPVATRVGAALAMGLVPLAAWSPAWLQQYHRGAYATAPRLTFARLTELMPILFAPHAIAAAMGAGCIVVTLAVLGAAVLMLRRPDGRLCGLCVLVPVLAVTGIVWISGERVLQPRNLIGVAPFAAIALAWSCWSLPWRRAGYAAAVLVGALVASGFTYGQVSLGRTPYGRIAAEIRAQGFRPDEPILWFGRYYGITPVAWYLTADGPAGQWPRVEISSPTGTPCRVVEVVARTRTGRRWLAKHRGAILAETSVPSYGDLPLGRRTHDVVIARVSWSPGILDRPARGKNRHRFHLAAIHTPCLRP
jgi:hypothetical protein